MSEVTYAAVVDITNNSGEVIRISDKGEISESLTEGVPLPAFGAMVMAQELATARLEGFISGQEVNVEVSKDV